MLVLSRKKDESIVICDEITIQIVEIRGDKVRLGIDAPREVPVDRFEVWVSKQESKQESEQGQAPKEQSSEQKVERQLAS